MSKDQRFFKFFLTLEMSQTSQWQKFEPDANSGSVSEFVNLSPKARLRCPHCGMESEHDLNAVSALGVAVCQGCKKSFDKYPLEVQAKLTMLVDDFLNMKVSPLTGPLNPARPLRSPST